MAPVNFSVPNDVEQAFNETYVGENKSAVLTQLMCEAIEARWRRQRRAAAIDALLELRAGQPAVDDERLRMAREEGRP